MKLKKNLFQSQKKGECNQKPILPLNSFSVKQSSLENIVHLVPKNLIF